MPKLRLRRKPTASDVGAQPSDSDLSAIAALTTTSYGRGLLTKADAAALVSEVAPGLSTTFVAPSVIAPAPTGVASTDTANLVAAVAATPEYGWLHLRSGEYLLNAALALAKNIRVTGSGVFQDQGAGSVATAIADAPSTSPFIRGTVLVQTTAATDCIQVSGTGKRVDLSDFGIRFDGAHRWTNTGHGVNATSPTFGSNRDNGLASSIWRNLMVFGHDGNHYAYNLVNPLHCTLEFLRSFGGGVFSIKEDSASINYGNILIQHTYGALICAGTADGYHLESPASGSQRLNLITVIRPQCNAMDFSAKPAYSGVTKPLSTQALWNDVGATLRDISIIAPDLENGNPGVTHPVTFGGNTYVQAEGGFTTNAMWYRPKKPYNAGAVPTITAGSGVGTSPTLSINAGPNRSTDLVGIMNITTGTSPGAAGSNVVTITFAQPMTVVPAAIMLTAIYNAPPGEFWVSAMSTTGFTIRCTATLAAATQYQLAWDVKQ